MAPPHARHRCRALVASAAAAVALLAVGAAAGFDPRLECVDKAKRTGLNGHLQTVGGSADIDTAICVKKLGPIVGHSHVAILQKVNDVRMCDELVGTRHFIARGCGLFAEVSARLKALREEIYGLLDMYRPLPTGADALASRNRVKCIIANEIFESMSRAALVANDDVLEEFTKTRAGEDARLSAFAKMAVKMTFGVPATRFSSSDANDQLYKDFVDVIDGRSNKHSVRTIVSYMMLSLQAHATDAESARALRCFPVTLPNVGLSGGNGLTDDSKDYSCTDKEVTKKIKQLPACARLAVGQLLGFNRAWRLDKNAPWKLTAGVGVLLSGQAKSAQLPFIYKKKSFIERCQRGAGRKIGKKENDRAAAKGASPRATKPHNVVCWAFTQCYASAAHFTAVEFPACKGVVEDTTPDDDAEEAEAAKTVTDDILVASKEKPLVFPNDEDRGKNLLPANFHKAVNVGPFKGPPPKIASDE